MSQHRAELICDLAETYRIYDYKRVPVSLLGTLVCGLGDNTRIGMKLAGVKAPADTILLPSIYDLLNVLLWSKTEDAAKGRNAPEQLAPKLFEGADEKETVGFATGEDYEKARAELLKELE